MDVAGKRVLILGLAREGESLARFLSDRGAQVTVTDGASPEALRPRVEGLRDTGVRIVLGGHHPELVNDADMLFVSPGVPESSAVYAAAIQRGIRVESMTTLFFELCRGTAIGVTGSSGKTTTTGLIGGILRSAGLDVVVGGNIGDPMLDLLPSITPQTLVVLELSSFQLALLRRSPHVAVVTNITPNHLDRHGTMDAYIAAKRHIVEHQRDGDHAVLNWGDPLTRALAGSTRARVHPFALEAAGDAACAVGDWLGVRNDGRFVPVLRIEDVPLLGRHNVENVLAAIAAAGVLGVDPEAMSAAVKRFRPAPHRLQVVGEQAGVRYIDDSIATSPARAIVALQAIDAPVILIAGGRDKRLPWDDFARVVSRRVRALLLIGEAADDIEAAVRSSLEHEAAVRSSVHHEAAPLSPDAIHHCDSLETAVDAAQRVARPGDVVLLSPACTSYDMFRDFEERGHAFARAVSRVYAA